VFLYREEAQTLAVQGIQVATISQITTPIRASFTNSEILEHCRNWKQLVLGRSSNLVGDFVSDAFSATLVTGDIRELFPAGQNLLFEECKNVLNFPEGDGRVDRALSSRLAIFVRIYLEGRSFFLTEEGLFGVCPQFSKCGDRVAVVLGCNNPLILRPIIVETMNRFLVIGESYVHELMSNQAFLGSIPEGWRMNPLWGGQGYYVGYSNAGITTQQDPRVPLPSDWRYMYGSREDPQEIEAENEDERTEVWFKNVVTGKETSFDPRLTPDALRQRGVDMQELVLV
jgi:hypothetical protein